MGVGRTSSSAEDAAADSPIEQNPSFRALEELAQGIAKRLTLSAGPHHELARRALVLDTPSLRYLLGAGHDDSPWRGLKNERHHRKNGAAISPQKAILYTLPILDALGVFETVTDTFWQPDGANVEISRPARGLTPADVARLATLRGISAQSKLWIADTIEAWSRWTQGLAEAVANETVILADSVTPPALFAIWPELAHFVDALVEVQSNTAKQAAQSRRYSRARVKEAFVSEIERHPRLHLPCDIEWMAAHWDEICETVDSAINTGNQPAIERITPILTHFSYVFEGSRSVCDRVRIKLARYVDDQAHLATPGLRLSQTIEGEGFLLLDAKDFTGLRRIVGNDEFAEYAARLREALAGSAATNRRLTLATVATHHRLRAHLLTHEHRWNEARAAFAAALTTAIAASNESLAIAVLLDRIRMWRSHPSPDQRAIMRDITRANELATLRPSQPNLRRLVALRLVEAQLLSAGGSRKHARRLLRDAEMYWHLAQPRGTKLPYQHELLKKIDDSRANIEQ